MFDVLILGYKLGQKMCIHLPFSLSSNIFILYRPICIYFPGALTGPDLTVGVSQSTLGMSVGTTIWLAALTLILFILMAVSFNRWRQQRRQQRQSEEDDVTSSHGGDDVSVYDATSVAASDLNNVTVETTSAKSCHNNSAFSGDSRTPPTEPNEGGAKC